MAGCPQPSGGSRSQRGVAPSRHGHARPAWLAHAAQRYLVFLRLMRLKRTPQQMLVPTYDIDLLWHAHMVHPQWYSQHSVTIAGKLINHDDGFNDRGDGETTGALDEAFSYISELWLRTVGSPYSRLGGMYRGVPRPGFDCEDYPLSRYPYPECLPDWRICNSAAATGTVN